MPEIVFHCKIEKIFIIKKANSVKETIRFCYCWLEKGIYGSYHMQSRTLGSDLGQNVLHTISDALSRLSD